MGYINDFRAKLGALIEEGKVDQAVKYAADICLESYRNGMKAASGVEEKDVRRARRYGQRSK